MLNHINYKSVIKKFRTHNSGQNNQYIPFGENSNAGIFSLYFSSQNFNYLLGKSVYHCRKHGLEFSGEPVEEETADSKIEENIIFSYPVFREKTIERGEIIRRDQAIILLHGLNERSFTKYIPWAYQLWEKLSIPVILFPLAFHINRISPDWARQQGKIYDRRLQISDNEMATRYNAVISDRLEMHPARFFWGTVQSYYDLIDLVMTIRSGSHPHFAENARIDFLGYSAGGYLSLLLLLENKNELFSNSRAVIFGSGVPMRDLNLLSPLILDSSAEDILIDSYLRNIKKFANERMNHWFEEHGIGRWFRAFSGLRTDTEMIEKRMNQIAPRILGICNTNDQVMPLGAVLNTLCGVRRNNSASIIELDLGIHESPFVCPPTDQSLRRAITEPLSDELYGNLFENFISESVRHFSNS